MLPLFSVIYLKENKIFLIPHTSRKDLRELLNSRDGSCHYAVVEVRGHGDSLLQPHSYLCIRQDGTSNDTTRRDQPFDCEVTLQNTGLAKN